MTVTFNQAFFQERICFLLFSYLPKEDKKSLGKVDKFWLASKLKFDVSCYKILYDRIRNKEIVYIVDGDCLQEETILSILASGGSKKAVELKESRALMVPNMDSSFMNPAAMEALVMRWKRMVYEEVSMSRLLTQIGLLTPLSKRVDIVLSKDAREGTIPAYLSETFQSLITTKGYFIIDSNQPTKSTWGYGKNYLFESLEDRLEEKNWNLVLHSLLKDVATICEYNIPGVPMGDSVNTMIIKKTSEFSASQYEVRYFGFDFSNKIQPLSIPKIENKASNPNVDRAMQLFEDIVSGVFAHEFGMEYVSGKKDAPSRILKEEILEKYKQKLLQEWSKWIW